MIAHATYTHWAQTHSDAEPLHDIQAGETMWGETHDWLWWTHERAAEVADSFFAEHRHIPGLAACRVTFEIPEEVWVAGVEYDRRAALGEFLGTNEDHPVHAFIDELEWDATWLDRRVTVIRQNDLSAAYRRDNTARMERIARRAGVAA